MGFTDPLRPPPALFSRGSCCLLPSIYADARNIDAVIVSQAGCRCMKCMLNDASAEHLAEETPPVDTEVPSVIAKLTPDPEDDLIPAPAKPSRWKQDGLTFKLFSKLFSSNDREDVNQNEGARARAVSGILPVRNRPNGLDGPAWVLSVHSEYLFMLTHALH